MKVRRFTIAETERAKERTAFTLAEVLITLGIIGVVAAMTLPSLISNYKKNQTVVQLKKVYSTLAQGIKQSEAVNGDFEYWPSGDEVTDATEYFNEYWKPYFNVGKLCSSAKDCGYDTTDNLVFNTLKGTTNGLYITTSTNRTLFTLANGTVILVVHRSGENSSPTYSIYADLNGPTLPNIIGKDVFMFTHKDVNVLMTYCHTSSETSIADSCKINGTGNCCSTKIQNAGWEIEDDYPW